MDVVGVMEIPTEVAIGVMSVALAAVTHAGRTIYLLVREHQGNAPTVNLSEDQIEKMAEVVGRAIARDVALQLSEHQRNYLQAIHEHGQHEEGALNRLLHVEENETSRLSHIEEALGRLVAVEAAAAPHRLEQHRAIMERLNALEQLVLRECRAA